MRRSQWLRSLRCRSAASCLLRSWVRIPPGAWMFICCECCVLSGRGLCDELITRPEESYPLWCVIVCDLETSRMRRPWPALGRSATEKKKLCMCRRARPHHFQLILFEFQKNHFQFIFQMFVWECRELASHVRQRVTRFCILSPSMFLFLIRSSSMKARNVSIVGSMSKTWVILLRTYCQFCWIPKISVFQA